MKISNILENYDNDDNFFRSIYLLSIYLTTNETSEQKNLNAIELFLDFRTYTHILIPPSIYLSIYRKYN